ncbi:MAG: radical SAM protein [Elusimicrobia bacterium]|nr:radical SAM protein [Elusimicrobiota bacterium]
MHYKNIVCKTALNKISLGVPYKYDLNIYRGCAHGCKYCFALYTHKYISQNADTAGYFNEIFIKTNIAEALEKTFRQKTWKGDIINIGGVTDSYQNIEKETGLTRQILKLCIKYKNPVTISTKSSLILRDYDLIDELSKTTFVGIASTITTPYDDLSKILEPQACSATKRFKALQTLSKTSASIGIHIMPVIPYLTDTPEAINLIYENAVKINANYLIYDKLNLRGDTKKTFLNFLYKYNPDIYRKLVKLYRDTNAVHEYKLNLEQIFNAARIKYNVTPHYSKYIKQKLPKKTKPVQCEFNLR